MKIDKTQFRNNQRKMIKSVRCPVRWGSCWLCVWSCPEIAVLRWCRRWWGGGGRKLCASTTTVLRHDANVVLSINQSINTFISG